VPIITISRDSYSYGEEIAGKIAAELGYGCIGADIVQHVCETRQVPLSGIKDALYGVPGMLDRITAKKEQRLAMFRAVLFSFTRDGNIVYYGLAGHIFFAGVPNVLKVRLMADLDDRVRNAAKRDGFPPADVERKILAEDRQKLKWTKRFFRKDDHDPGLYDLCINLHDVGTEAAAKIVTSAIDVYPNGNEERMRRKLSDMALAAEVEARLLNAFPEVQATAKEGQVFVQINGSLLQEAAIVEKAEEIVRGIEGIKSAYIGVTPSIFVPF
jgi:cytidylate kinase